MAFSGNCDDFHFAPELVGVRNNHNNKKKIVLQNSSWI